MLEQLARDGIILSVMTFEDHMNPQVHWIEPEEFGIAFDLLTERERPMPEAAHTNAQPSYPGYVNIQRDEVGAFVLTVRGDSRPGEPGTVDPTSSDPLGQGPNEPAATVQIMIAEDDFHQLIADAQRMQPVREIEPVIEELAAVRTEEEPIEPKPIPEDVVHEPDAIVVDTLEVPFKGDAWPGSKPEPTA